MIFSDKLYKKPIIELIFSGEKIQTRRLVKEGEYSVTQLNKGILTVKSKWKNEKEFGSDRTKWRAGESYAVQFGKGKHGVHCCQNCGFNWALTKAKLGKYGSLVMCPSCAKKNKVSYLSELRIIITSIHKEKLLDIKPKDIAKEGFESKDDFLVAFAQANFPFVPSEIKSYRIPWREGKARIRRDKLLKWNPVVWVLGFKVKRGENE